MVDGESTSSVQAGVFLIVCGEDVFHVVLASASDPDHFHWNFTMTRDTCRSPTAYDGLLGCVRDCFDACAEDPVCARARMDVLDSSTAKLIVSVLDQTPLKLQLVRSKGHN